MLLSDFTYWLRGAGLEILLIGLGAALLHRFVRWQATRIEHRLITAIQSPKIPSSTTEQDHKYHWALIQIGSWSIIGAIYFLASLFIMERFNVPRSSIVAPASIIGAAVGFGAQQLIKDLISGGLIVAERQYGYGDVVRFDPSGSADGVIGTVEEISLRTTKLRAYGGELITVPNGDIRQVANLSKDWSRAVIDIPLPNHVDLDKVREVLTEISNDLWEDELWRPLLLERPTFTRINSLNVGYLLVRYETRTAPGEQWSVAGQMRERITQKFQAADISLASAIVPGSFQ
ncbi:MAG: mechanosensitive ion channel family protein [Acidimicrobiia bacterium]